MALPTCTSNDLDQLIRESGYPFELKVGNLLQSQGYAVRLSHQFFHPTRERDCEIDILATRNHEFDTKHAGRVRLVLELAIECKDNSLPYVLFGFPSPPAVATGMLDPDSFYCKIRTTDDKSANFFAFVALDDSGILPSSGIKASHHQFGTANRFHQVAAVELHNGKLKFNVSERLRNALNGLAGYVEFVQATWMKGKKSLVSEMPYDPTVWVTFLLLIHSGEHYRYTTATEAALASHTTLFTSFHSDASSVSCAVDFVSVEELFTALRCIESSFDLLAKHIVRYLKRSPRPLDQNT